MILAVVAIVFTCFYLQFTLAVLDELNDANGRIILLEFKTNYIEQSEKTLRESVNLQTKCIRDLNDIVKEAATDKGSTEPDAKALLAGWDTSEPEEQIDIMNCQRLNPFAMQSIINNMNYRNVTAIYPWQQQELNRVLGIIGSERNE